MNDRVPERETIIDEGIDRRERLRKGYAPGADDHGDEEASGAIAGGIAGAAVGAVVGGPVGAVVGGIIGAAGGATGGLADEKRHDREKGIPQREERR